MSSIADRDIIALLESIEETGAAGSALTALVDDTTPQLGGTLDLNGFGISVATKFRIKADGTFQLYNPTTSKFHTLSLSGADGAVVLAFAAGES